jgi:prepilin peptidase CpaA
MHPVTLAAALAFMVVVSLCDLRARRIPNRLNLVGLVVGLALQIALGGWQGFFAGLSGFGVGVAILFVPFAAGMVGGGDVKFVAAAGAFLGWQTLLVGLGIGVVAGGVVGAYSLIRSGRFLSAMRGLAADMICIASGVRPTTLKSTEAVQTVPYGVLLAMGLAAGIAVTLIKEVP